MLEKLAEILQKHHLQITADKTLSLLSGAEDDQTALEAAGMSFRQTSNLINKLGNKW